MNSLHRLFEDAEYERHQTSMHCWQSSGEKEIEYRNQNRAQDQDRGLEDYDWLPHRHDELYSRVLDLWKNYLIISRYIFQPIAVETLGPINGSAVSFLSGLGRRIAEVLGESREGSFLFQRLSVLIQRSSSWLLCWWGGRSFQLIL